MKMIEMIVYFLSFCFDETVVRIEPFRKGCVAFRAAVATLQIGPKVQNLQY